MAITRRTFWGIAVESAPGTAATAPTYYLPLSGLMKRERKPEYSTEERGTRDTNFAVQYTTRKGGSEFKGKFYIDTVPYLMKGAMGTDTPTQPDATHAPTVYKHTLALADSLSAHTVFKSYDSQTYQSTLNYFEKFSIKITAEGKLIEFDTSTQSCYPAKYVGTALVPSYSTVKPLAGYAPTLTLGGVSTTDINELDFEFSQKLTPWFAISGSPDMTSFYPGERTAHLNFTARFDNTTIADLFDTIADSAIVLDLQGKALATYLSTTYYEELNMTFPTINFDSIDWDQGKDNVLIKVKATCRPSASPLFTAWAQNTVASYAS